YRRATVRRPWGGSAHNLSHFFSCAGGAARAIGGGKMKYLTATVGGLLALALASASTSASAQGYTTSSSGGYVRTTSRYTNGGTTAGYTSTTAGYKSTSGYVSTGSGDCYKCPPPRNYDSQEVVKKTRDIDQSRVIETTAVVPSKRLVETNHLIVHENETR